MSSPSFAVQKTPRDFRRKLFRWYVQSRLHAFARQFSREEIPVMVCFSGDFVSNAIFVDGFYEREDLDAITAYFERMHPEALSGTFVDVGANIGNHSVYFSRGSKKIIAIEPHPRIFRVLQLNVDPTGGKCINCGVGEAPGELFISTPAGNNSGRTHLTAEGSVGQTRVEVRTLDSILEREGTVSLIKVDVEGMEAQVFRGARTILRDHRPIILFEQSRQEIRNGSSEAIDVLREHGYTFLRLLRTPEAGGRPFLSGLWLKALVLRLIKGEALEIIPVAKFEPDSYSMIVAVPGVP